jgi:exodeoxyribonuclease I
LTCDAPQLQELLYTRTDELPAGAPRPGLKSVHVNRCPVLLTPKMADPATALRLGINGEQCRKHLEALRRYRDRDAAGFTAKVQAIYTRRDAGAESDPDLMLYSGGFFSEHDKRAMDRVRAHPPDQLAAARFVFEDRRLPEMLFRYRARNYPQTLTPDEDAAWDEYRFQRLTEPQSEASYCLEDFQAEIEALLGSGDLSPEQSVLLEQLLEYADTLLA